MCKVSAGITRHPGPSHLLLYTVCDTLSFNHFKPNTEKFLLICLILASRAARHLPAHLPYTRQRSRATSALSSA